MTIAAQPPYTPSEQPIVKAGHQARRAGVPINENPYPAVCPASLRRHWLDSENHRRCRFSGWSRCCIWSGTRLEAKWYHREWL